MSTPCSRIQWNNSKSYCQPIPDNSHFLKTWGVGAVFGNAQMQMHTHSARNARLNAQIGEKCINFKKCHKMISNSWLAHIREKLRSRIFSRLTSYGLFFQIWPHPMTAFDLVGKNDNWKVYSFSTGLQQASVILGSRGDPNFGLWPWPLDDLAGQSYREKLLIFMCSIRDDR